MEQIEAEKHELERQNQEFKNDGPAAGSGDKNQGHNSKILQLEQELNQSRDQVAQAQREIQKLQTQIRTDSKESHSQSGPVLSKSRSLEVIINSTI